MFANLNPQQLWFFVILIAALVLFMTEWIRTDVVALLIVVALYVTRILKADEALAGFSSEPAIVVAGIFVLSGALHVVGTITQLMSDAATTALFAPIALAQALGRPPEPLLCGNGCGGVGTRVSHADWASR